MNKSQLQQMRNDDITQVDRSDLVNICDIHIDDSLPATVKARIYFDQVINPYCVLTFRVLNSSCAYYLLLKFAVTK